ncbi:MULTISPECIES: SDR family oxidoreductase [Flavobacteriaceae]|uniref:SDR family oxidoreductase n=1 Tax=Flavobacteriaceae TaxID=49546 RepID=UPI0039ED84D6
MKKVLVTGASGMLGMTLVEKLKNDFEVYATGGNYPGFIEEERYMPFDLSSDNYQKLIEWSNPDVIVHSGAITNGNVCQNNPELAFNVNGLSLKKIMDSVDDNVKIIYISTDAVFPASLHLAEEGDCTKPENNYGKSKELGEFFLLNSDRKFVIIRTTIVGYNLNPNKKGFVEWIVNSLENNEEIGLFEDVIFTPISIYSLSKEINYLIEKDYINSEILHISGGETCSKYQFGTTLAKELNLIKGKINRTSILSFKERAKRSTDQSLCTNYYQEKFKRKLPTLNETIKILKEKHYEINSIRK